MRPKSREQQLAKDLFLHTEKTQQEIADILNINRKTIYLWIKQGRWEEFKIAARQAPCIVLQDIWNHIDEINYKVSLREDRCPTPVEVDMLRKLLNMTKIIEKKHTGAYIEAFQELTMYVAKKDLPLAQKIGQLADGYIKGTIANKDFHFRETYQDNVRNIPPDDAEPLPDPEPVNPSNPPVTPGSNAATPNDAMPGQKPSPDVNLDSIDEHTRTPLSHSTLNWAGESSGSQQGNDGAINHEPSNPPKPAPVNTSGEKTTNSHHPIYPIREKAKNRATSKKRIFRHL